MRSLIAQGADASEKDSEGITALYAAATEGHTEIVQILIDAGADLNHADSGWGPAVIDGSLQGNYEVVELLLKGGARMCAANLESVL